LFIALPPLQGAQKIDQIAVFVFGRADAKATREAVELATIARRTGFRRRPKGKERCKSEWRSFHNPFRLTALPADSYGILFFAGAEIRRIGKTTDPD
jgi:hypothetical protein